MDAQLRGGNTTPDRIQFDPSTLMLSSLVALQRSVGNAAVTRLIQRASAPAPTLSAAQVTAAQAKSADLSADALKQLRTALGLDESGTYDDAVAQAVYKQQRAWQIIHSPGVADYDVFGRLGLVRTRTFTAATLAAPIDAKAFAASLEAQFPTGVSVAVYSDYDLTPVTPGMTEQQKKHAREFTGNRIEFKNQATMFATGQRAIGLQGGGLVQGVPVPITSAGEVVEKVQSIHLGLVAIWKAAAGLDSPDAVPPAWTSVGSIATFCHGHPKHRALDLGHAQEEYWATGLLSMNQSAAGSAFKANLQSFVQGLSGAVSPDLKFMMFSCNVGGSPGYSTSTALAGPEGIVKAAGDAAHDAAIAAGKSEADAKKARREAEDKARPGAMAKAEARAELDLPNQEATGAGSLAESLEIELEAQLGGSPSVFGHLTAAHTTRNPEARVFGAEAGPGGAQAMFDLVYDDAYVDAEMKRLFPTLHETTKIAAVRKKLRIRMYVHYFDQITQPTFAKVLDRGPKGHEKQPIEQEMFADLPTAKTWLRPEMSDWLDIHSADIGPRPGDYPAAAPKPGQEGAMVVAALHDESRPLKVQRRDVSEELASATTLPAPSPTLPGLSKPEEQVLSWLEHHKAEIEAGETKFHVDRRAIAGAIAWEALKNPETHFGGVGRWALAPGKPHYSANKTLGEGEPITKEVEEMGIEPSRTMEKRRQFLEASPANSIEYIGAVMYAYADIASKHGYDIRCDPAMLTNCYQGGGPQADFREWDKHLKAKKGAKLVPGNDMAIWTSAHITYLETGVGPPDAAACAAPATGLPAADVTKLP